jgi:Co/Zn/Cd efflux system component
MGEAYPHALVSVESDMDDCCVAHNIPERQRRVFRIVLLINVMMFLIESLAGILSASTALLADSLDMLGDAFVYGISLYAIGGGTIWQARAAALKGIVMGAFGLGVLVQVALTILNGLVPLANVMGSVGLFALTSNVACLALLSRHRDDDINMRSAWTCSRNDVIGNVGVLIAAVAVSLSGSAWPDIIIGLAVGAVFCRSALFVLWEASRALQVGK